MDEENKFREPENESAGNAPEEKAFDSELDDELNKLETTFREVLQETAAEAEADGEDGQDEGPVIQELEEESDDEMLDGENDMPAGIPAEPKKEKKKSRAKTVVLAILLTIVGIIAVIVIVGVIGVKLLCGSVNPEKMQTNFLNDAAAYSDAIAKAEDYVAAIGGENADGSEYDNAVSNYETAVSYCTDDTWYSNRSKKSAVCALVKLVYENEGYQTAYAKLMGNMAADEAEKCSDATVKEILATAKKFNGAALEMTGKLFEAAADEKFDDVASLTAQADVPEEMKSVLTDAFNSVLDSYRKDIADADKDSKTECLDGYYAAYTALVSSGADGEELVETLCSRLYDNGCIYTAIAFGTVLGEDYEPKTDAYKTMLEKKNTLADSYSTVFSTAKTAAETGKTGAELLKDDDTDAAVKAVIADVIDLCAQGIAAQKEKNLTVASAKFGSALSACGLFGISDPELIYTEIKTLFDCGGIPDAQSMAGSYVTDEVKAAFTDEQKAEYDKMMQVFTALESSSEIFSSYYSGYMYYGQPIDTEALNGELDALITEDSNNYDKAFVSYCKYYAATTTGDSEKAKQYLDEIRQFAPDLPFVYGYFLLSEYIGAADWDNAEKTAAELLAVNAADDFAVSVGALRKRMNKDYAGAAEAAEKGIALIGENALYCAKEAGVAYMLSGDYENAYNNLLIGYGKNLTLENCDLLLILNYLGKNSAIADKLQVTADEITQTLTSYQAESFEDTLAILAGEKTAESVLTSGSGTLGAK